MLDTTTNAVPVTHPTEEVARRAAAAVERATTPDPLSPHRERWARRIRKAADDLHPVCSPAMSAAIEAFAVARLRENADDDEAMTPEALFIRRSHLDELHFLVAEAPALTVGDVAAKIALAMETENGGAMLRRERAEAVVADASGEDVSLAVLARAYLDCLRLATPAIPAMPRVVSTRHNTFLYLPAPPLDGSEWSEAVSAYNAAVAICEAENRREEAWEAACHAACPPENQYLNEAWGEPWPKHCTMKSFERDEMLPHERARLQPIIEEFVAERERLRIAHGVARDSHVTDDDPELDAMWEAEERVLSAATPSVYALAQQQRLAAYSADSPGYDDLGRVMYELSDGYGADSAPIRLHQHTLVLAGIDDPILHLEPFSPVEWLKSFEAAGGVATSPTYSKVVILGTDEMKAGIADPVRRRAVEIAILERVQYGGDRVFSSDRKRKGPLYSDDIEALLAGRPL